MRPLLTASLAVLALAGAATAGEPVGPKDVQTREVGVESVKVYSGRYRSDGFVLTHEAPGGRSEDRREWSTVYGDAAVSIDGRPATRSEVVDWVAATRNPRAEIDTSWQQYGAVVAVRFKAGPVPAADPPKPAGELIPTRTAIPRPADTTGSDPAVRDELLALVRKVQADRSRRYSLSVSGVYARRDDGTLTRLEMKFGYGYFDPDKVFFGWGADAPGGGWDFTQLPPEDAVDHFLAGRIPDKGRFPWAVINGRAVSSDADRPAGPITDARELIQAGGTAVEKAGTAAAKFERAADAAPAAIEKLGRVVLLTAVLLGAIAGLAAALAFRLATRTGAGS